MVLNFSQLLGSSTRVPGYPGTPGTPGIKYPGQNSRVQLENEFLEYSKITNGTNETLGVVLVSSLLTN